jgi:hypothetical protein
VMSHTHTHDTNFLGPGFEQLLRPKYADVYVAEHSTPSFIIHGICEHQFTETMYCSSLVECGIAFEP